MNDPLGLFETGNNNDPLGLFSDEPKKEAGLGTAIKSAFANIGNMADLAGTTIAGGGAALFGDKAEALRLEEEMLARRQSRNQWANPENQELTTGSKVAGALATLPMQIVGMGLSPVETTFTAKGAGETNEAAIKAGLIDAAGNAVGIALPGWKQGSAVVRGLTGAGAGAGQEVLTKKAIQSVLETEQGKEAFAPTTSDALVSGILGGGFGVALGRNTPNAPKATSNSVNALREAQAQKEKAPTVDQPVPQSPEWYRKQEALAAEQVRRETTQPSNEVAQHELFDQPSQGRTVSEYEAYPGDWRVDENGMPIRVDLSLDLQNAQQPAQRNLWGDELDVTDYGYTGRDPNATLEMDGDVTGYPRMSSPVSFKGDIENQQNLPSAIDQMDPAARTAALEQTQLGRDMPASGEMEAAKIQAEKLEAQLAPPTKQVAPLGSKERKAALQRMGMRNKQGGVIGGISAKDFDIRKRFLKGLKEVFETDDSQLRWRFDDTRKNNDTSFFEKKDFSLGGLIDHPDLFKAYPDLKQMRIDFKMLPKWVPDNTQTGQYSVTFGGKERLEVRAKTFERAKEILLHEIQHAVQRREGWDPGTSPKTNTKRSFAEYRNNAGEVEARFTENRAHLTPEQRARLGFARKQGGAIDTDLLLDVTTLGLWRMLDVRGNPRLTETANGTYIPEDPVAASVLADPVDPKGDIKVWKHLQSGASSVVAKTGNKYIAAAADAIQNAGKRAEKTIREAVFPTEKHLRGLSKQELIDLSAIFKDEMFSGTRYDGELLTQHLSTKQLQAYQGLREMFTKTLEAQNKARALEDLPPISEAEAYMSSRWQGRFRQPVHDANGKLVWYLAADSKLGLKRQIEALKAKQPDLVFDAAKESAVGSVRNSGDVISMYSKMLGILDRNDPAVAQIKQFMEEQMALEAEGALAQTKHFEEKGNIRGFVGDRPGKEGTFKEAVAMFEQQLQYAKNAFTWAELQQSSGLIKDLVSSPELQKAQPNTVSYIRDYTKAAYGMKESSTVRAVENRISDAVGVSPNVLRNAVGNLKSFFILQKLGFNLAYGAANVIQSINVAPYLANLMEQGYRGNPVTSVAWATISMPALAFYHYSPTQRANVDGMIRDPFVRDAFRYAEDNGIIARSLAEEAPLSGGMSVAGRVGEAAAKTMTVPEVMVRSFAYLTYVEMLRESKKFTNSAELFKKAEELTNLSMVDYRPTERAMVFGKLGVTGDLLSTLQTYAFSYFNQFSHMGREALKGRPTGLLAMGAMHMALAGAMGVPYFNDLEKLYALFRDKFASASQYANIVKSPFFAEPRLWMIENLGEGAVYGWLSDKTGLGLTSRVAAPALSDMIQAPGGPVLEGFKMGKAALGALSGDPSAIGQAAMALTPPGLQGLLETAPFMEGVTFSKDAEGKPVFFTSTDLADKKGAYARDEKEITQRKWGFRSQKEVVERDIDYRVRNEASTVRTRSTELVEDIYTAARNGNKKKAGELAALYTNMTGKEITRQQLEAQALEEMTTGMQKNTIRAKSPKDLTGVARALSILEDK